MDTFTRELARFEALKREAGLREIKNQLDRIESKEDLRWAELFRQRHGVETYELDEEELAD